MREDRNLMNQLEALETSDPALTQEEMQRLTRAVLARAGKGGQPVPRRRKRSAPARRLRGWGQVLLAGAACAVVLVGLNGFNPALAEGLPLVGNVFAYFNQLSKGYLQGNDLSRYAQPAQIEASVEQEPADEAQSDALPPVQATAGEVLTPESCSLTLSQIYCDELYLRVGLVLTAEDDTLAGFDLVTIDPPLLYEDTSEEEANTLYGGVTLNGEAIGGDLVPCFRKQDDHTFFCEMQYNLQNYTGDTRDMQASLTFSHLVGVTEDSEEKTPLEGSYNLNFTVSEDASLTRMGQIQGGEQNGVRLLSLKATPGETCVVYTAASVPEGVALYPQVFIGGGASLEWVRGTPDPDGKTEKCYFDGVPEGVTTLTVRLVDKNSEEQEALAEWTVTLPE